MKREKQWLPLLLAGLLSAWLALPAWAAAGPQLPVVGQSTTGPAAQAETQPEAQPPAIQVAVDGSLWLKLDPQAPAGEPQVTSGELTFVNQGVAPVELQLRLQVGESALTLVDTPQAVTQPETQAQPKLAYLELRAGENKTPLLRRDGETVWTAGVLQPGQAVTLTIAGALNPLAPWQPEDTLQLSLVPQYRMTYQTPEQPLPGETPEQTTGSAVQPQLQQSQPLEPLQPAGPVEEHFQEEHSDEEFSEEKFSDEESSEEEHSEEEFSEEEFSEEEHSQEERPSGGILYGSAEDLA